MKYSEVVGSFIRNGGFPLEADYVFSTEEELIAFYSEEDNQELLHQGWFKIVGEGDNQALYWVVKEEDELKFVKLIESIDRDTLFTELEGLNTKINNEIKARDEADSEIWGNKDEVIGDLNNLELLSKAIVQLRTQMSEVEKVISQIIKGDDTLTFDTFISYLQNLDHSSVEALSEAINNIIGNPIPSQPFRTLRGIEDFVRIFKANSENSDANLQSELDRTQIGIGLSGDGSYNPDQETYYLKKATSVMNALKILDAYIHDNSRVSTEPENQLEVKVDGLYYNADIEYSEGILTFKVNGEVVKNYPLGIPSILEEGWYDDESECIFLTFAGEEESIKIPVGSLIREWEVDNSHSDKVVELTKEEVIGKGTDKLSADVRLSIDPNNIIKKDGNTLLVDGSPIEQLNTKVVALQKIVDTSTQLNDSILYLGSFNTLNEVEVKATEVEIADKEQPSILTFKVVNKGSGYIIQTLDPDNGRMMQVITFGRYNKVRVRNVNITSKSDSTHYQASDFKVTSPHKVYYEPSTREIGLSTFESEKIVINNPVTLPLATTSTAGLMSASQVSSLNSLDAKLNDVIANLGNASWFEEPDDFTDDDKRRLQLISGLREIGYTETEIDECLEDVPNLTMENIEYAKQILAEWNPETTSMNSTFKEDYNLVIMPKIDTSKVTDLYQTWYDCRNLAYIPLLDVTSVTDAYQLFVGMCPNNTTLKRLPSFYFKSFVASKYGNKQVFMGLSACKKAHITFGPNTQSVRNTFQGCDGALDNIKLIFENPDNVTDASGLFRNTRNSKLNLNIGKELNLHKCTDVSNLFEGAQGILQTAPDWSDITITSTAESPVNMKQMFDFVQIAGLPKLDIPAGISSMEAMFECTTVKYKVIPDYTRYTPTSFANFIASQSTSSALERVEGLNFANCTNCSKMFAYNTSASINYNPKCKYIRIINLGQAQAATNFDFHGADSWGADSEENLQSLVDSLLTNSFNRAEAGYETATITLKSTVINRLSDEQKAAITAKGYTLVAL